MSFEDLHNEIIEIQKLKGWDIITIEDWPEGEEATAHYKIVVKLALTAGECHEAIRALRFGDRENFAEELGDILIWLVGIANGIKIDFIEEANKKITKNWKRPRDNKAF